MKIRRPEWLQVESDNQILYGYNQGWYTTSFQRTRGCGPTAAAMMISYLNRREAEPLPFQVHSIPAITKVLENVWDYVTPGWLLGLNSTKKFCKGVDSLLTNFGLSWRCQRLSITASKSKRVSLPQVVKFLEDGITSDCPIAFLNLHRGREIELESWHWVVVLSLFRDVSKSRYMATCYDGGRSITFDLGRWLDTTRFGGGFVYITTDKN